MCGSVVESHCEQGMWYEDIGDFITWEISQWGFSKSQYNSPFFSPTKRKGNVTGREKWNGSLTRCGYFNSWST